MSKGILEVRDDVRDLAVSEATPIELRDALAATAFHGSPVEVIVGAFKVLRVRSTLTQAEGDVLASCAAMIAEHDFHGLGGEAAQLSN